RSKISHLLAPPRPRCTARYQLARRCPSGLGMASRRRAVRPHSRLGNLPLVDYTKLGVPASQRDGTLRSIGAFRAPSRLRHRACRTVEPIITWRYVLLLTRQRLRHENLRISAQLRIV